MIVDRWAQEIEDKWNERRPFGICETPVLDLLRSWPGKPIKETDPPAYMSARPSERGIATKADLARFIYEEFGMLDSFIQRSDVTECLTSPHKYIRECKRWYEEKLKEEDVSR